MGIAGSSLDEEEDVSRERSPDYFSDENEEDYSPRRQRHRTRSGQSNNSHSPGERPQRVSIGTTPTELRTAAISGSGHLVPIPISNPDGVGEDGTGEPRGTSPRRVSAPHRVSTGSGTTTNASLGVGLAPSSEGVAGRETNHYHSERPQTLTLTPESQSSPQNLSDRSSSPGSHSSSPDPPPPAATAGTGDIRGATSTPSGGPATGQSSVLGATTPEPSGERNTDVQRSDVEPLPQGWTRRFDWFGRAYYVNEVTYVTTWDRPTILPSGWERRFDQQGRAFYVDHNTRTTTWRHPNSRHRETARPTASEVIQPDYQSASGDASGASRNTNVNSDSNVNVSSGTTSQVEPAAVTVALFDENANQTSSSSTEIAPNSSVMTAGPPATSPIHSPNGPHDGEYNGLAEEELRGPLPPGWEKRMAKNGKFYFVNHNLRMTQWEDPRPRNLMLEESLPAGWDMRYNTRTGALYFVDHKSHSTTYIEPRTGRAFGAGVCREPYERSFHANVRQLHFRCRTNRLSGSAVLHVNRDTLLDSSYTQLMTLQPADLRRKLVVFFDDEEGLDYGGVARDWFCALSHVLFSADRGLFQFVNEGQYAMQISPHSSVQPEHLKLFRFVGRVLALALFHQHFVDTSFAPAFYKMLLGRHPTLVDLESVDAAYYSSLKWIAENDVDASDMELYFAASHEFLGQTETTELRPGGANVRVTENNKMEYIDAMVEWRFSRGVEQQTCSLLTGFNEVLPLVWLRPFDERQLELLLCGIQQIDVEDWRENTEYRGGYHSSKRQIRWFWRVVEEASHETRAKLLQFVTGTTRVPLGGFAHLRGANGPQNFSIERIGWCDHRSLPRAHTCFNRLDLPAYRSFAELRQKLLLAIEETSGFGRD